MVNISEIIHQMKPPVILALGIFAIALYSVITFQWLPGLTLIIIILVLAAAFWYIDVTSLKTEEQNAWVIIALAVLAAATATAISPWLVWAVAFTALFLLLHVLARIERRLSMLEYRSTRRILRRRTRGGAGPRHRA